VSENVLGRDLESRNFNRHDLSLSPERFEESLQQFQERGERMPVALRWGKDGTKHSYHEISVQKIENGYV
jgi:hypothetical protein